MQRDARALGAPDHAAWSRRRAQHDATLRPLPLEVATIITGGFRDLVITALDQGRDLTELQDVAIDVLRRITMN